MRPPAFLRSLFAFPYLATVIIVCQVTTFLFAQGPHGAEHVYAVLSFIPDRVLHDHEWWRIVTFLVLPPVTNPIFLFCSVYFFWLMSSGLEGQWGFARFNLYFLIGWAALVAYGLGMTLAAEHGLFGPAGGITGPQDYPMDSAPDFEPDGEPGGPVAPHEVAPIRHYAGIGPTQVGNAMIGTSIFLAFAWLYPRFQIYMFFILPVQVRYLAMVTWFGYLYALCTGVFTVRLMVLAAITNFLVYFGSDIVHRVRRSSTAMTERMRELNPAAFHKCASCGLTEQDNSALAFRICTDCQPARELCGPCLKKGHDHIVPAPPDEPKVRTRW